MTSIDWLLLSNLALPFLNFDLRVSANEPSSALSVSWHSHQFHQVCNPEPLHITPEWSRCRWYQLPEAMMLHLYAAIARPAGSTKRKSSEMPGSRVTPARTK